MKIVKEIISYALIVLIVILIRTFIITPAMVDGESMEPALNDNELVLISKLGIKAGKIKRYDIVVVDYEFRSEFLLKRVIGLPGENIMYLNNVLYVNGQEIDLPFEFEETANFEATVPEGCYFVLGDNRDVSYDSRMFGSVKLADIKGKAKFVLFPFNKLRKVK